MWLFFSSYFCYAAVLFCTWWAVVELRSVERPACISLVKPYATTRFLTQFCTQNIFHTVVVFSSNFCAVIVLFWGKFYINYIVSERCFVTSNCHSLNHLILTHSWIFTITVFVCKCLVQGFANYSLRKAFMIFSLSGERSVPSKPKKNGIFGTVFGRQPAKILKIGTCIFWTQFPSLEKISQNSI